MSIPFIDNAFLPEYEYVFNIVEISGAGIAFVVQLCIGALVYWKLRRSQTKISRELVIVFYLSFVCALLFTSGFGVSTALDMSYGSHPVMLIARSILLFFYGSFLLILLLNLVMRLYVTFQDTPLRMNQHTVQLFVALFVVGFVLIILGVIGRCLILFGNTFGSFLFFSTLFLGFSLYVVGSVLAVRLFVMNLSSAAKMQASSVGSESDLTVNADDISLNVRQQKLLHLAAKYILLFFVAILSTMVAWLCIIIVSFECGAIIMFIDFSVNLQCLYLQFAFATKHYRKCCKYLDLRSKAVVLRRAKLQMLSQSLSAQRQTHSVQRCNE